MTRKSIFGQQKQQKCVVRGAVLQSYGWVSEKSKIGNVEGFSILKTLSFGFLSFCAVSEKNTFLSQQGNTFVAKVTKTGKTFKN